MDSLIDKISEYQLFNFLLTGTILVVALSQTTAIDLVHGASVIQQFFVYYFIGLLVSRVGSLVVEPVLKRMKIVVYAPYDDYLKAEKKDPKLSTLSQENNMYRTLIATSLVYLIIYGLDKIKPIHNWLVGKGDFVVVILSIAVFLMFTFAYRKQTSYMTARINRPKAK